MSSMVLDLTKEVYMCNSKKKAHWQHIAELVKATPKDTLKKAFADAHVPAEVTVYDGTIHGWCVRDMPPQNGKPIYSRPDAERAWGHLLSLYKTSLA